MVGREVLQRALNWSDTDDVSLLMDDLRRAGLDIVSAETAPSDVPSSTMVSKLNKTLELLGSMRDKKIQGTLMKQVVERILALPKN